MDDVKKTYREGEQTTKEAWRKADGDDSLADKVGNAGDEIRKDLGNAGDDLDDAAEQSTAHKEAARKADGDESLADKVGNAGDDLRRDMGDQQLVPPLSKRRSPRSAGASSRPRPVTWLRRHAQATGGAVDRRSAGPCEPGTSHSARGDRPMPQKAWSDKRERQYEHIKESYEDRGVSEDEAEERAARTVNKTRAEHGETKSSRSKRS